MATGAARTIVPRLCLAVVLLFTAGSAADRRGTAEGRLVANGVEVTVTLAGTPAAATAVATFLPQQAGFHVYSIDLPDGGIDGLGIPTRLAAGTDLHATGRATTDAPVRSLRLAGLDADLPVYPDGPVTVVLPVSRTGPHPSVLVSYGSCSATRCLIPVRDAPIPLTGSG